MAMYLLMFMGLYLAYYLSGKRESGAASSIPDGAEVHINRLWNEAVQSLRLNRFIRAEKALLAMLHIDEHNVAAYNRLGVLKNTIKQLALLSEQLKLNPGFHLAILH